MRGIDTRIKILKIHEPLALRRFREALPDASFWEGFTPPAREGQSGSMRWGRKLATAQRQRLADRASAAANE